MLKILFRSPLNEDLDLDPSQITSEKKNLDQDPFQITYKKKDLDPAQITSKKGSRSKYFDLDYDL